MSAITINDVAALAGVSMKTVSRVLNREPHVTETTRERVMQAAQQLNYRPNLAARALAGSRAYLVALFFNNPSPSYVSGVQFGAMSACRSAGYHLLVERIDGEALAAADQIETFLSGVRVDGVILTPPVSDQAEVLDLLARRAVPVVRLAPAEQAGAPFIYMDDERAAFEMTEYLIGLGHRRIGFVKGPADHSAAELRFRGFRRAMRTHQIPNEPEAVAEGDFTFRSGWDAAVRLLNSPQRPTAIFASNDDMALGVLAAAHRLHLAVPEQVSIAGFDDSPGAQVVWPQLTTVRQPMELMASRAVERLIGSKAAAHSARSGEAVDFTLVVRGSTAPPAQTADA